MTARTSAVVIGLTAVAGLMLAQAPNDAPKVALVVGVNEYDNRGFNTLAHAENDATELNDELRECGFTTVLLTGSAKGEDRATRSNILARLKKLLEGIGKRSTVLVSLSGHGQQLEVTLPGGMKREDAFFCPVDAVKNSADDLLSLSHLIDDVLGTRGGRNLLLVDACRDVPKDPGRGSRGVQGGSVALPPDTAVLFSCRSGQRSFEDDGIKHGLFTHCVLEGLRGKAATDGRVTWTGLVQYVENRMADEDLRKLLPKDVEQEPIASGNVGRTLLAIPQVKRKPAPLDCTGPNGVTEANVKRTQREWAAHLGMKVEETHTIAGVATEFVLIPPGKFLMGSPESEADRFKDEVQHEVTLTRPFYLAKYETTQELYTAVIGKNPSKFEGVALPVEQVSWDEATAFTKTMSQRSRSGQEYRLPTEAEWEYACRGGRAASNPFGIGDGRTLDSTQANFDGNSPYGGAAKGQYREKTSPVGSYRPNAFGLYDMHGNVWEWCQDWCGDYQPSIRTNPVGAEQGADRVSRGGSWFGIGQRCRAAHRRRDSPAYRYHGLGFRVCFRPAQ